MTERAAKNIIKDAIEALGVSQKDFALSLGVDPSTVTRWVKGTQVPRKSLVALVAEKLRVDEVELWRAIAAAQHDENRELRREVADVRRQTAAIQGHYDATLATMLSVVEINRDINRDINQNIKAIRSEIRDILTAILERLDGERR